MIQINYPFLGPLSFEKYYDIYVETYNIAEPESRQWWAQNIKPSWNIIDVGANIGQYTVQFAMMAPQGQVYAFEPTTTFEFLKTNISNLQLSNVHLFKIAVGNTNENKIDNILKIHQTGTFENDMFDFITLDSFVKANDLTINAIKIDVDGFDYEVLLGCKNMLTTQNPIVVCEINGACLQTRGFTEQDIYNFFNEVNYYQERQLDYENFVFKAKK